MRNHAVIIILCLVSPLFGQQPPPSVPAPGPPGAAVIGPKVEGLELSPADPTVTDSEQYVEVVATSKDIKPAFFAFGSSGFKYSIKGSTITVGIPKSVQGESNQVLVYCVVALPDGNKGVARTVITVNPSSKPKPTPNPNPRPNPGPVQALNVIILDNVLARANTPWMAAVVNNAAMRNSLKGAGHNVVFLDKSDPEVKQLGFDKWANKADVGWPALLLQNPQTGQVITAIPCPQSPNDLITVVNKTVEGR